MTDTRPQFEAILRQRHMLPEGSVMTDAILLAAVENFGDRTSYCRVYPDDGQQPVHRSIGLLTEFLYELAALAADDD